MDDVLEAINKFLKAYDNWSENKTLENAIWLERMSDSLKIQLGHRFYDLNSVARAAVKISDYITENELAEKLNKFDDEYQPSSLDDIGGQL